MVFSCHLRTTLSCCRNQNEIAASRRDINCCRCFFVLWLALALCMFALMCLCLAFSLNVSMYVVLVSRVFESERLASLPDGLVVLVCSLSKYSFFCKYYETFVGIETFVCRSSMHQNANFVLLWFIFWWFCVGFDYSKGTSTSNSAKILSFCLKSKFCSLQSCLTMPNKWGKKRIFSVT